MATTAATGATGATAGLGLGSRRIFAAQCGHSIFVCEASIVIEPLHFGQRTTSGMATLHYTSNAAAIPAASHFETTVWRMPAVESMITQDSTENQRGPRVLCRSAGNREGVYFV